MLATIYQLEAYRRPEAAPYREPPVTMRDIAIRVCERHGVGLAELRGHCRKAYIVRPRHEFFALARQEGRWSYPRIARWCGGLDHTTVLYGERAHWRRNPMREVITMLGHNGGPPLEAWA